MSTFRMVLDPVACDGHGLCSELFPEGISLDDWGYPVVRTDLADEHLVHARRAVSACPALALRMVRQA
jgi:ferredoxin